MGFEKLSQKFKDEILKPVWAKYAHRVKEEYGYDLATEGLTLRNKAQTDLFWLCNILGYRDLQGRREWKGFQIDTHQEMCDFFAAKDPSYRVFKDFALSDKGLHDRLLLVPRGGFKSSIDGCDCVQYTICWPDITILILTGVYSLGCDFVGEYSKHFILDEKTEGPKEMKDGKISLFQILFPEHCCLPTQVKQNEFTTPARRDGTIKECTVSAAGIEQNLSGWHYDVMKLDDVVTNENSLTQTRMQAVNRQINVNRAMLNPYGYFDKIGTWYDVADTYGTDMKAEDQLKSDGLDPSIKVLLRAALWPTPEATANGVTEDTAKETDLILWFPERLTFPELMKFKRRDQASYAISYLNNPLAATLAKFPRELMIARTVDRPPEVGMVFQAWDLAYSEKGSAKYTVGLAGLFSPQGIHIIDMVRGRFGEYELPAVMAAFAFKWKPRRVAVEDSMGARWLVPELRREQEKLRSNVYFDFISLGRGSKTKNKEHKAKLAARLLGDGRLYFTKQIDGLPDIYNELEAFPKGTFTDIACSLSLLVNHFANYADTRALAPPDLSEQMERLHRDRIYGLGRFAPQTFDQTMIAYQQGEQPTDHDPLAAAGLFT